MYKVLGVAGAVICSFVFMFAMGSESVAIAWISAILGIAFVSFGLYKDKQSKEEFAASLDNKIETELRNAKGFNASQKFISSNLESAIAIDESRKKVCIVTNLSDNKHKLSSNTYYKSKVYSYKDILQTEILHDGDTVSKTSRVGQLGGALLGGLLAGGVGAIVGGLSASKTNRERVGSIQLQVVVNDMSNSFYRINFGQFDDKVYKNSNEYRESDRKITHWHNLLSHLINQTDQQEDEPKQPIIEAKEPEAPKTTVLVGDELLKLSVLLNGELITREEFEKQKAKLLG